MATRAEIETALVIAGKEAQRGVKEEGHNAGARVLEYIHAGGGSKGQPWCAYFVSWSLKQAGLTVGPVNGRGATIHWRDWANTHDRRVNPNKLERGMLGGWTNKNGTGHIFWIAEVKREAGVTKVRTVEGNTDAQGSREGDGVYSKWRTLTGKHWLIRLWD